MSPHTTKLTDTSPKTDKHEEQLTEILSKLSAYETRLDKPSNANINKIDTAMKKHEEKMNKFFDKDIDDIKAIASSPINLILYPPN